MIGVRFLQPDEVRRRYVGFSVNLPRRNRDCFVDLELGHSGVDEWEAMTLVEEALDAADLRGNLGPIRSYEVVDARTVRVTYEALSIPQSDVIAVLQETLAHLARGA